MNARLVLAMAIGFFSVCASATDYTWKTAGKSGNWSDPDMWEGGDGTSYPKTVEDTVSFPTWTDFTVTFTEDIEIGSFGKDPGFNYMGVVFDFAGHTLTVHQNDDGYFVYEAATEKNMEPYRQPTFKNGTLICAADSTRGFCLGMGTVRAGGFTLDGCKTDLKLKDPYVYGPVKIIIKNGSVWDYGKTQYLQYLQGTNAKGGFIQVTGEGSELNMTNIEANLSVSFNGAEGGLYAQDGAVVRVNESVSIGGTHYFGEQQDFSANSFVEVENATMTIDKNLVLGGYYFYGFVEHDKQYGPTLCVKGKAEVAIGGALYVYDDVAAKFEYHVRGSGWKTAPVRAQSLTVAPRGETMTEHHGTTRNLIHAAGWAARSETVTPLLELTTENAETLATLAANSVVVDYDETLFPAPPTVSASADGKKLLLTAPAGVREDLLVPELTASCDMVGFDSERVTISFATFGRNCTDLDEVTVSLYDNAGCEGTPLKVNSLDVTTMTDPAGAYETIFGDIDLSKVYWAKAYVKNDCGCEATAVVKIAEDLLAPPQYAVTRDVVEIGAERVTLVFSSFGCALSQISEAKVCLYDNAACEGEPVDAKSLDVTSMTDPQGSYSVLFDGLDARKIYGVKVVVKNTAGAESVKSVDFASPGETGETFVWAGGTGVWERPENWTAASGYPTFGDEVTLTDDAFVTLEGNARIRQISGVSAWACPVLDLGGNTLETDPGKEIQLTGYDYATEEDMRPLTPSFTVKNGEFKGGTYFCTHNGDRPGTGSVIFDNCIYEGKLVKEVANGFRIFIQNGSRVTLPKSVEEFQRTRDWSGYGFICVRGEGSTFESTFDNQGRSCFDIEGFHNGLYVQDGAVATIVTALTIGHRSTSTNSFIEVDDATLNAKYALAFGYKNIWGGWDECEHTKEPTLRIKGERARVNVGTDLHIVDGLAARIAYTVPTNGFSSVPLTAATLQIHERTAGRPNVGPSGLAVNARDWKRAHPLASQTLLSLTTANQDGLQRLVDHSTVRGSGCTLAVSADGKSIVLTAPDRHGTAIIIR